MSHRSLRTIGQPFPTLLVAALVAGAALADTGPADKVKVTAAQPLSTFAADVPTAASPRVLRLVLPGAYSVQDKGKPRTSEVRLELPVVDGRVQWERAAARIADNKGKVVVQPPPASTLALEGGKLSGAVVLVNELPGESVTCRIELTAQVSAQPFGYLPDPEPSIPPWRAEKGQPSGQPVKGEWTSSTTRGGQAAEAKGTLGERSAQAIALTPGVFGPVNGVELSAAPQGGMAVTVHLAEKRVWGGEAGWAVKVLDQPVDLKTFNGVRLTVNSERPYAGKDWTGPAPVGVAVAVRMKGGPWYMARTVTPLLGGVQTFICDFAQFGRGGPGVGGGPNLTYFLEPSAIDAVAIGIANPFGVGPVSFTAQKLEAVRYRERGFGEAPTDVAEIQVQPGTAIALQGVSTVPKGLFGYHTAGSSKAATGPVGPEYWRQPPIEGSGRKLLELTRPGFLRPLEHTGMGAKPITVEAAKEKLAANIAKAKADPAASSGPFGYDLAAAGDAADQVMLSVTNSNLWRRPEWMDADLDAYTEGIRNFFREWGARGWTPDQPRNTLRMIELWNEPFMWGRHINRPDVGLPAGPGDPGGNRGRKAWNDPTQFSYLPAKLGGEVYARFFNAAAQGLKEVNPHAQIGGMCTPAFGDDFFEYLKRYLTPWLDASKDHVDFVTEHHYQGEPARYAADYEVFTAYTLARYGKRWPIWNTEANDLDDVAPGDQRSPEMASARVGFNRAYYNAREILELIRVGRDKVHGRALHAYWNQGWLDKAGEYQAYHLLSALRGTVLGVECSDPGVVTVATRAADGRLVIVALNDTPFERRVRVQVDGTVKSYEDLRLRLNPAGDATVLETVPPGKIEVQGSRSVLPADNALQPRELRRWIVDAGQPAPGSTQQHVASFADTTLVDVLPGKPVTGRIKLEPATAAAAKWYLQVVTRDVQAGEATLTLGGPGGLAVALPAGSSNDGGQRVQQVPLDAAAVRAVLAAAKDGSLAITLASDAASDGWVLYSAAVVGVADAPGK